MTRPPFTLWYSVLFPGRPLDYLVCKTIVPSDMQVVDFAEMIAQTLQIPPVGVKLYKTPNLYIRDLSTARITMSDLGEALVMDETLATIFDLQPAQHFLHLIVFRSDMPMPVWCWIRATTTMLQLAVERQRTVNDLSGAIKESAGLSVSIEHLELYKFSYRSQEELDKIVRTWREGELLPKAQELQTAFYNFPLTERVCVVVELVEHKRTRSWDVIERARKRQEIAPSSITPSEYYIMQTDTNTRFLNQRLPDNGKSGFRTSDKGPYVPDQDLPPTELLYAGFGQFIDMYRAKRHSDCVVGSPDLRESVELFAERMSRVYDDERKRQSSGLSSLKNIFSVLFGSRQVIAASSNDTTASDSHYVMGEYGIPCILVEFKNEAAYSKAIPAIQLSSYYGRIVTNVVAAKADLLMRSRLPALGLTIIGPVVTFYALAYVGSTVYSSLTPGLSCVLNAGCGDDRRALHAAFIAAVELLALIEEDARKLCDIASPPPVLVNHFFPDIRELPSIQNPGTSIKIKITGILHKGSHCLLYRAESPDRDLDLVIKVARSYSSELHQFCAERGHAPTLHAVKKFPGNIVVVAMDHIGAYPGLDGSQEYQNNLGQQLRQLVEEFHFANFVHGDLRVPNIHCVNGRVMLMDFDWGGKVGEAFYPPRLLTLQLRQGRDMSDLKITKDDDDRVLKSSLMSIGCES